ncbi:hypothetical protein NST23_20720 [Brevibacillus sp. FSL K6-0770]|jgi:hypothetical protein|uniref:hypothetical protein n=1 Tax=Brevibacillus TaxID=55080 RepID=UPI00147709E3|nr:MULTISPECIES: hypothetical protein [Brevibacillus]NRQ54317.1 hypothetical protein [Brevibacillus sp. HD1.4A]
MAIMVGKLVAQKNPRILSIWLIIPLWNLLIFLTEYHQTHTYWKRQFSTFGEVEVFVAGARTFPYDEEELFLKTLEVMTYTCETT